MSTYCNQYKGQEARRTVANDYSADLVLGDGSVRHQAKRHQNPWQVWRGEH